MDVKLTQNQTQKLILIPQLRQFLELLEIPSIELIQRIEQELVQNPTLEEKKSEEQIELQESSKEEEIPSNERDETMREYLEAMDASSEANHNDGSLQDLSFALPADIQKKQLYRESLLTNNRSLANYLEGQLGVLDLSPDESKIAKEVIGNIDDEGRLVATNEEIAKATSSTAEIVEEIIKKIQRLDPPGVGGRNLQETLLLQLQRKSGDTSLTRTIVEKYMPQLEKKQFDLIARSLSVSAEKVKAAYRQIIELEPYPGRIFLQDTSQVIVPDAIVVPNPENEDEFLIDVTNDYIPQLRINPLYRQMLKDKTTDPATRQFLREKIQAGLDLIRAILQRKSTIRQITEELVQRQKDFFSLGFSHLRPLRLKDISEKIGVHESTVSRAIQNKYISTPQGTIPYKSFFSSKMESENGSNESQKSVMERLKHMIASENKSKPYSDAELVKMLDKDGIKISRRTVAKYRDRLKLLPTYLRKER
ncbi:MAG: RNA polymerase sigma-54 factor [Omnitrophica bacterium RIFCSPLOWO2_12_FULL_44_17]|uniref:RNA polymerase sigma-54 factor n=1 Tax=Candidatus Danuiimicrobium aquiferis TaxID=1801832 RepID=A0A1G1KTW1_9BACT|nr:MAG: RNA polymerase sigma-54 factor [Omnitrophica bacterium RIFCSPHIGHO2_02_FULL_45_28]OGW90181.1 MAG: RNA polymerase sigma-54 factor [Omnitrophica bacterium RIFCSPHIGHO2_12_FULL_44_12]OGW96361.1 MAG: RNA polymerase sigma-54 factor [Omnitrophica bacterium RIFCSPLOWO2_12_FULL_44_17]OGX04830.1 MAG: RNA polymerase sigma-54 factor [Omnitrophica bacterium RIFCSPLOWO2_02_FULL_44_11]